MFERYTEKARRVIFFARYEASDYRSPYIETEHILLGIVRETPHILVALAPNAPVGAFQKWRTELQPYGREKIHTSVDLPLSNENKRVLAFAAEEAERLGRRHIGVEHLILGLLRERHQAFAMLEEVGITLEKAREHFATHDYSAITMHPSPALGSGGGGSGRAVAQSAGGIIEFMDTARNERVGIVGMRAIAHLPRPGDIVELADMNLGKRRFRVKDVVHMYELLTEAPQYRNQEPARIVITVELVEGATAQPGYEGMT